MVCVHPLWGHRRAVPTEAPCHRPEPGLAAAALPRHTAPRLGHARGITPNTGASAGHTDMDETQMDHPDESSGRAGNTIGKLDI